MTDKEDVIKIWVDETYLERGSQQQRKEKTLVGYLITNADTDEYDFFNELTQARKKHKYWKSLHAHRINKKDHDAAERLLDNWLQIFHKYKKVYFHCFLYTRNDRYVSEETGGYEGYFAKQSVFALAHKMKRYGTNVETMFKDISTVFVLFDNREGNQSNSNPQEQGRSHIYRKEITRQIEKQARRDSKSNDLNVKFSFVSLECFDGIQFTDCLLYMIRSKEMGKTNFFVELFDKYFIYGIESDVQRLGYKAVYQYEKKFNFFEAL